MSNEATVQTERKFKTVNGKKVSDNTLIFINPKKLSEEGITGVVAEGLYQGTVANNFDGADHKLTTEDGSTVIINSNGSLNSQLSKVEVGSYIRVSYLGKNIAKKGKYKGKAMHNFMVEVAE